MTMRYGRAPHGVVFRRQNRIRIADRHLHCGSCMGVFIIFHSGGPRFFGPPGVVLKHGTARSNA